MALAMVQKMELPDVFYAHADLFAEAIKKAIIS
jgi:hypothetical protein